MLSLPFALTEQSQFCGRQFPPRAQVGGVPGRGQRAAAGEAVAAAPRDQLQHLQGALGEMVGVPHAAALGHPAGTAGELLVGASEPG